MTVRAVMLLVLLMTSIASLASAQVAAEPASAEQAPPASPPVPDDDPDRDINVSQPDFTLITLPTTLRVPRMKSAFRVTHRFQRSLAQGDVGDFVDSMFGIDNGASVGLEYRFGLMRRLQVGVTRTSDRTIDLFADYNVLQQGDSRPLGLNVRVGSDGTNNFRDVYSPVVGVTASRELGRRGALYVAPALVVDANLAPAAGVDDHTLLFGLGARLRVLRTTYLLAEYVPRAGYAPGADHIAFSLEKRAGGHAFQINLSNGFGITPGQLARGGTSYEDWYLGFNISRKFF